MSDLNSCSKGDFVAALSNIFEYSPWIAEQVATARPFVTVKQLFDAMKAVVDHAPAELRLALIKAHPDLADKAQRTAGLTVESDLRTEQEIIRPTTQGFSTRHWKFLEHLQQECSGQLVSNGEVALAAVPEIFEISMACPNMHFIPMNLSAFGMDNNKDVFLPTDEPHGQIECTVGRG